MSQKNDKDLYVPERARIVETKEMTDLEKYFRIKLLDREALGHAPGQFVMVTVYGVGEVPISVSSPPNGRSGEFELVVRKAGNVTQALHNLGTESLVGIRGPFGTNFTSKGFERKDILFIAGGIGLVPLRSFIKQVVNENKKYRKITILYGAKSPDELLFKEEMDQWGKKENVEVKITVDKGDPSWKGNVGVITTLIPPLEIDIQNTLVAVVGPPVMYKFVILSLASKKVANKNIYLSLERRMKCGVGKCGNCQIQGSYACQDGPVYCFADIEHLKEAL
ncbi:MAG: FAD/NAD(P)-binding protein [Spirochaetes bacterium]|nr:FAD/NAD(P)-binding protein [Spirochaetota bacterium]